MRPLALHDFDTSLCGHVCDVVAGYARYGPRAGTFARWLERALARSPALLAYLRSGRTPQLLLGGGELEALAQALWCVELDLWRPWVAWPDLYRSAVDCVAEIRENLTPTAAKQFTAASARFARRLEAWHLELHDGIELVGEWVAEVRRLKLAMGRRDLLPRPEGRLPTPTHPLPPGERHPAPQHAAAGPAGGEAPETTPGMPPGRPEWPEVQPGEGAEGIGSRLDRIEAALDQLVAQRTVKDLYSTAEAAGLLGRAEFTVREWCRQRRVRAKKRPCGRGLSQEWVIPHAELQRIRNEGILPVEHG